MDQATGATRVEEISDGVWALPVPMPGPLGSMCAYVLEVEDGALLLDAGWNSPEALDALERGLGAAGFGFRDLRGVLFTHGHPDHYGLASRLRDLTDAWFALHEADAGSVAQRSRVAAEFARRLDGWLEDVGMPLDERRSVAGRLVRLIGEIDYVEPDRFIFDGDAFELASGRLLALHTPGHSRGHVCFVLDERGLVFAGDHVLARTTPHISAYMGSAESPLDDYLSSLRRLGRLGDLEALPSHGPRFRLGPRVQALIDHHEARLVEVRQAVAEGKETVLAIATRMTWSRPWEALDSFDRWLAAREALAHLILLERRGEVVRGETRPFRWRPCSG
jgi:glyoxylase-like metal-dependent hydrolase (beta-lactamase superfamily II)